MLPADRGAADHDPLGRIVALHPAADFHPREDRHLEVDEQGVERAVFEVLTNPFAPVLGFLNVISLVAQKLGDERPEDRFVFHEEE